MKIKFANLHVDENTQSRIIASLKNNQFVVSTEKEVILFRRKRHDGRGASTRFVSLIQMEGRMSFENESIICIWSLRWQVLIICAALILPCILLCFLYASHWYIILSLTILSGIIWQLISMNRSRKIIVKLINE